MHRSQWRNNFIKLLLKGKPQITTKGFCIVPEEIDLIDKLDETLMDIIGFHGFNEDGYMITFSQLKVANVKKNSLTFRNSNAEVYVWEDDVIEQKTINKLFTGKMNLTVLEPFKKWRISFQGFLKSVGGEEKSIDANISLLWQRSSDPYEYMQKSSLWSFAIFSAKHFLAYNELKRIITGQAFRFDQWGELCGTLDVDQSGEKIVHFTSPRSRSFSKNNERDGKTQTIHYIKMKDKCRTLMLIKDSLYDFKTTWPLTFKDAASNTALYTPDMEEMAFTQDGDCKALKISSQSDSKYDWEVLSGVIFKRYYVSDEDAFGCQMIEENKRIVFKMNIETSPRHTYVSDDVCNIPLAISFKESLSKRPDLVGGKGASLSTLLAMEDDLGVIIPMGFCVTTNAYIEHHIRNKQIDQLHKCYDNATLTMTRTKLSDATKVILIDQLHTHFGGEYEKEILAVRSSAVGEDGLESSSAGQMETILSVKGYDSIIQAILKCWASSLSFNIVECRRQHGQRLMEPMAVVVLKMIKSVVSCVLFTADPLTNKGSTIVINAFPGLGEVVVSGKSNVDTIFITRNQAQHLNIRQRISSENKQDSGKCTSEQDMCLTDEIALKICRAAILIEAYVLGETDQELMHEFDTPVTDWKACFTTANIGEMLPGITTPLIIYLFGHALDLAFKQMYECEFAIRCPTYASMLICTFYYRILVSDKSKTEMFIMGETLLEHSMPNIVSFSGRKLSHLTILKWFLKVRFKPWRAEKILRSYEQILEKSTTIHHSTGLNDLMEEIESNHEHYFKVWEATMYQNAQSAFGSAILMSALCGKSNKITPDVSADLARLLSSCKNVHSANVPAALADLAAIINESNQKGYFLEEKYRLFLDQDGHRWVREADFMELSWAMDPTKLIQCLKAPISHGRVDIRNEQQGINEIVENLRSPLTSFHKLLFRTFLVYLAREGVGKREWRKSITIKMGDVLKQAYWKLADVMVQENIETRSAELARKSRKRRNITQTLMSYSFKKVNYVAPIPLRMDIELYGSPTFEGKRMPVSRRIVTGRASVIKNISEVGKIHTGDNLICLFTDVGWTPYFPLLSGLVTEIGGLLSHGAVVARKYGLPCIFCMSNATKRFKTGDIVNLNATNGILYKIDLN
ncbi:hypothetical protein ACJMK2_043624 [Sinanodonta woodiana]|uniref:Phosphoenolpyruvate synthase n=1 Tax=Sinanodonta woodiana TaxID=1069815 RepID=A0ABD3W0P0_SINWO